VAPDIQPAQETEGRTNRWTVGIAGMVFRGRSQQISRDKFSSLVWLASLLACLAWRISWLRCAWARHHISRDPARS
jgi:hypothetical protein